jgi:hypothetical protein
MLVSLVHHSESLTCSHNMIQPLKGDTTFGSLEMYIDSNFFGGWFLCTW